MFLLFALIYSYSFKLKLSFERTAAATFHLLKIKRINFIDKGMKPGSKMEINI